MFLREALPRFYSEAVAAIAAKPDDELPSGLSRNALLAQFKTLIVIEPRTAGSGCGSFSVTAAARPPDRGYAFSFDFDIPSGNVIADLDRDLQITRFEPVSAAAMHDIQSQLDSIWQR
jgi:hypothetical protein